MGNERLMTMHCGSCGGGGRRAGGGYLELVHEAIHAIELIVREH